MATGRGRIDIDATLRGPESSNSKVGSCLARTYPRTHLLLRAVLLGVANVDIARVAGQPFAASEKRKAWNFVLALSAVSISSW
jgi:hypothetical protein